MAEWFQEDFHVATFEVIGILVNFEKHFRKKAVGNTAPISNQISVFVSCKQ